MAEIEGILPAFLPHTPHSGGIQTEIFAKCGVGIKTPVKLHSFVR